jgi:hypothetical protein
MMHEWVITVLKRAPEGPSPVAADAVDDHDYWDCLARSSSMIVENFREYLEEILRDGYTVRHDEHGSDPDLIDPGGNPIETWRADYPYEERMERDQYEREK